MMMRGSRSLLYVLLFACSRGDANHPGVHSQQAESVGGQATAGTAQPTTDTVSQYCPKGDGGLRVSDDSIGLLDLSMNLGSLRAACLGARDTVWYGENDAYPAVMFPFDGLIAVAVQYEDSLLPNQPAERWFVRGTNGLVLGHVPLSASWAQLQRSFGAGIGEAPNALTVMFCKYRRILFELDASPDSVTPGRPADLSRIPSDARIKELVIFHEINPTWSC